MLPLAALGMLSTLFLLSQGETPQNTLPIADADSVSGAERGAMGTPVYAGLTESGDTMQIRARTARQADGVIRAQDYVGTLTRRDGGVWHVTSDRAAVPEEQSHADLAGNVLVRDGRGWQMRTDALRAALDRVDMSSTVDVTADGPLGRITAGAMHLRDSTGKDGLQLTFSDGVRMIYDPRDTK